MAGVGNFDSYWTIIAYQFKRGIFDIIVERDGKVHDKQLQALRYLMSNEVTELCYGGAAGGGKSWLGAVWLTFMCLCYPETRYFVGREAISLLEGSTLLTFYSVFKAYGVIRDKDVKYNANKHYLEFSNGSRIDLLNLELKPSDPDFNDLGSYEFTSGWIEEAKGVHSRAFAVVSTRIGRCLNDKYGIVAKMYVTCNPTKNWVYNRYYAPFKRGELQADYIFLQAWHWDNVHQQKGYERIMDNIADGAERQRLRDGNFDYDDDDRCLCSNEYIDAVFNNTHVLDVPVKDKYISSDLAMKGKDRFVTGLWRGFVCNIAIDKKKASGKEIEEDLRSLMINNNVKIGNVIADSDGMGAYLESYIKGIVAFHGGAKASNKIYFNVKSECGFLLAELINKRELYIICSEEQKERIREDLKMLMQKSNMADDKRKQLIGKDMMKEKLGRSPDYLDMLLMRMWFKANKSNIYFLAC